MIKKIILVTIPLVLTISHLGHRLHTWNKTKGELRQMKEELAQLKEESANLREKGEYYQSEEFILREAREKLGMTQENQTIFVLPKIPDLSSLQAKGEKYASISNWQQWYQLFFSESHSLKIN